MDWWIKGDIKKVENYDVRQVLMIHSLTDARIERSQTELELTQCGYVIGRRERHHCLSMLCYYLLAVCIIIMWDTFRIQIIHTMI